MYTDAEIVSNPTLRRQWDVMYLIGIAPPPLPQTPEMAWYHYVLNGHLRYARLDERVVRDDVQDLFRVNPQYFRNLSVYIPVDCRFVANDIYFLLKRYEYAGSALPLSDPMRQRAQRFSAAFEPADLDIAASPVGRVTARYNNAAGSQHSQILSRGPQDLAHDQVHPHGVSVPRHSPQVSLGQQCPHCNILLNNLIPEACKHQCTWYH